MATTTVSYDGDGVQVDFTINYSYTARSFVQVWVDAVLQVDGVDYDFFSATVIRFDSGSIPPIGTLNVELRRVTGTAPLVDWEDGAAILEADQDLSDLQMLHIVEELENNEVSGMGKEGANWDAESLRITDVAAPIADTDVATKASIATQVTTATDAADAAANHESVSSSNAIASGASATLAQARANAAQISADSIFEVMPVEGLTVDRLIHVKNATEWEEAISPHPVQFSSASLSDSAVLDLSMQITDDKMLIELTDLDPVTDGADLWARMSVDGGSSYHATNDYTYVLRQHRPGNDMSATASSVNQLLIAKGCSNVLPGRMTIEVFPGDGTVPGYIRWVGAIFSSSSEVAMEMHGNGNILAGTSDTRITHLRLMFSTGNINAVSIKVYSWVVPA